jgi:DNA-binding beta-propeller fold protein YncE
MRKLGTSNRIRAVSLMAGFLLVCPSTPTWGGPPGKNKSSVPTPALPLVWPLPPEKPRFRFEKAIYGAADVQLISKPSRLQRLSGIQKQVFSPSFVKAFGIATDSRQRIYVTDNGQAMVFVFDLANQLVSYIGLDGAPRLVTPMGITVDAKDRVWLADAGAKRVYAFDSQLILRAALGKQGELINPVAVATDLSLNRLYVADSKQHCIAVYDTETGLLITKFGKRGMGEGEFAFPTGIAVGADSRIYVADAMNRRVQIFDPDYRFVSKLGTEGLRWGQFRKPKSVALDSNQNIYVLDTDFNNFQVFDQKHQLLMFLGELGDHPGQFAVPEHIHISSDNKVYVVDQMNFRIQIFQLLSTETEAPAPAAAAGTTAQR